MPRKPKRERKPEWQPSRPDPSKQPGDEYDSETPRPRPVTPENSAIKTPKCGQPRSGKTASGAGKCGHPAGWGTEHPGEGPCKLHGGNNATFLKQLARKRANENALKEIDHHMQVYGKPIHIGPHEALLMEVQRTAGHVTWLYDKIQEVGTAHGVDEAMQQWTLMGIKPSFWVDLYIEERKHLVNVSRAAIQAGVAERQVALAEEQGKLLAMAIRAILWDDELGLTPQQRTVAPLIIRRHLLSLPVGDVNGYPVQPQIAAEAPQ